MKRLREHFGDDYGISVACEPDCFTRITLRLSTGGGRMIKVLIVDDEPLARAGKICAVCSGGRIFVKLWGRERGEAIGAVHKLCDLMCCSWIFRCRVSVDGDGRNA